MFHIILEESYLSAGIFLILTVQFSYSKDGISTTEFNEEKMKLQAYKILEISDMKWVCLVCLYITCIYSSVLKYRNSIA